MFKNLRLGVKMGVGFGTLIAITILLGSIAVWQMKNVEKSASILSKEFIPEVNLVNDVEKNTLLTMFQIRGYAFTENKDYLDKGKSYLNTVKKLLEDTKTLIGNSSSLKDMKEKIDETANRVNQYENLLNDSTAKIGMMAQNRLDFNTNALTFSKTASEFIASQEQMMNEDISKSQSQTQERIDKFVLANEIIGLTYQTRMSVLKSLLYKDAKILTEEHKELREHKPKIGRLAKINQRREWSKTD